MKFRQISTAHTNSIKSPRWDLWSFIHQVPPGGLATKFSPEKIARPLRIHQVPPGGTCYRRRGFFRPTPHFRPISCESRTSRVADAVRFLSLPLPRNEKLPASKSLKNKSSSFLGRSLNLSKSLSKKPYLNLQLNRLETLSRPSLRLKYRYLILSQWSRPKYRYLKLSLGPYLNFKQQLNRNLKAT